MPFKLEMLEGFSQEALVPDTRSAKQGLSGPELAGARRSLGRCSKLRDLSSPAMRACATLSKARERRLLLSGLAGS